VEYGLHPLLESNAVLFKKVPVFGTKVLFVLSTQKIEKKKEVSKTSLSTYQTARGQQN
jgi:hypothetical protein